LQEIEYLISLSSEMEDRLRVSAQKEKGEILEFMVQDEALISNRWNPIIRYDTAHGFSHRDRIWPSGSVEKQPLFFDSYNLAFTYATLDLKANWISYRRAYEQEMKT
jgi:hypothetical protein